MHALEFQFRAALAFAYSWVNGTVIGFAIKGKAIDIPAVAVTYLLIAIVPLVLYRVIQVTRDAPTIRTICYVSLGALCAAAPQFW